MMTHGADDHVEIPTPDRLYTWVDVERHFADLAADNLWPSWLRGVSAYWEHVSLKVATDTDWSDIHAFLTESLGALTYEPDKRQILLETPTPDGPSRALDVEVEHTETTIPTRAQPRWATHGISAEHQSPTLGPLPQEVPVSVFHSFKGGVGRTLHCVATALELANRGQRVLLIDADLEAPGITWMWQSEAMRSDFSFEDAPLTRTERHLRPRGRQPRYPACSQSRTERRCPQARGQVSTLATPGPGSRRLRGARVRGERHGVDVGGQRPGRGLRARATPRAMVAAMIISSAPAKRR